MTVSLFTMNRAFLKWLSPSQARMGRYLPPCDILFGHIVQQFLQFFQKNIQILKFKTHPFFRDIIAYSNKGKNHLLFDIQHWIYVGKDFHTVAFCFLYTFHKISKIFLESGLHADHLVAAESPEKVCKLALSLDCFIRILDIFFLILTIQKEHSL